MMLSGLNTSNLAASIWLYHAICTILNPNLTVLPTASCACFSLKMASVVPAYEGEVNPVFPIDFLEFTNTGFHGTDHLSVMYRSRYNKNVMRSKCLFLPA